MLLSCTFLDFCVPVMTAHDYDQRDPLSVPKGKGVYFVTNKPPGGQGIIRPRRDQIAGRSSPVEHIIIAGHLW